MTIILVFNCGSSSLSYKVYRPPAVDEDLIAIAWGKAFHVATQSREPSYVQHSSPEGSVRVERPLPDHRLAAQAVLEHLEQIGIETPLIGHRFVHGGADFQAATLIDVESLPRLQATLRLAPIHNPNSLSVIELCRQLRPQARQYAMFDTAFHAAMPEAAYRYALPIELADRLGLRKYGFHGLSYQYCTLQTARILQRPAETVKMVACHLGTGGSSVAAIRGGRSLDTSMGYSPLPGLMMSTRSGDIDPAIVLELIQEHGYTPEQVNRLLNKDSGLIGVSGLSSDLLELVEMPQAQAKLAVEMYVHRLKHYIGAFLALLGGADALVFTDDIGVRGWPIREAACRGMEYCGLRLDNAANRTASITEPARLSASDSTIAVLSIPTDEEYVIALEGQRRFLIA